MLDELARVPWHTAARIYGNSHASLVGLIVHWWITAKPDTRWALDGGPAADRGTCDALLCEGDHPIGVLEVQSVDVDQPDPFNAAVQRIDAFFRSNEEYFANLDFALLLLYPVRANQIEDPFDYARQQAVERLAWNHCHRRIVVVALCKRHEQAGGVRCLNDYYKGRLTQVKGYLYREGRRKDQRLYFAQ